MLYQCEKGIIGPPIIVVERSQAYQCEKGLYGPPEIYLVRLPQCYCDGYSHVHNTFVQRTGCTCKLETL